jgi:hypothetical protein
MSYTRPMRPSALAVALLFVLTASVRATTVLPMSFSELVNESAAIVYGRIADVRGQWTQDRHAIESLVTVEVMTAFKGSPGSTATFSVPGGQAGRFSSFMPGAPTFSRGDLVVVFLTDRGVRLPGPTGFSQGIFRAAPDQATGAILVTPPVIGSGTKIVRGDPQRRPMSLTAFRDAVRAVAGTPR